MFIEVGLCSAAAFSSHLIGSPEPVVLNFLLLGVLALVFGGMSHMRGGTEVPPTDPRSALRKGTRLNLHWGRVPDWVDPFTRTAKLNCPTCHTSLTVSAGAITASVLWRGEPVAACSECGGHLMGKPVTARLWALVLSCATGALAGVTIGCAINCHIIVVVPVVLGLGWIGRLVLPLVFARLVPLLYVPPARDISGAGT